MKIEDIRERLIELHKLSKMNSQIYERNRQEIEFLKVLLQCEKVRILSEMNEKLTWLNEALK